MEPCHYVVILTTIVVYLLGAAFLAGNAWDDNDGWKTWLVIPAWPVLVPLAVFSWVTDRRYPRGTGSDPGGWVGED